LERPLTIAEAADQLGVHLPAVQKMIDRGELEVISEGSIIRITRASVLKYLAEHGDGQGNDVEQTLSVKEVPFVGKTPPAQTEKRDKVTTQKSDLSPEVEQKRKELTEYKALKDIETERVLYDIKLNETLKLRDLPEVLIKKSADLQGREVAIKQKELELANRAKVQDEKETKYNQFCLDTDEFCKKKREEADQYFGDKVKETDEALKKIKFDLDTATIECKNKEDESKNFNAKVAECQKQLDEIAKQAKAYTHQVEAHATQHYYQARAASGQDSTSHDNQANKGWDLQGVLNDLVKKLEALLR
jgi:excisionase family DNA binding protein